MTQRKRLFESLRTEIAELRVDLAEYRKERARERGKVLAIRLIARHRSLTEDTEQLVGPNRSFDITSGQRRLVLAGDTLLFAQDVQDGHDEESEGVMVKPDGTVCVTHTSEGTDTIERRYDPGNAHHRRLAKAAIKQLVSID